ncbi:MAG TPA: HEAT repeat domain-containing protein [Thermoanaerobaculia bacterium]|nr:HEAT repeat domain-containing protein [Thermoanaerobaculia bacterium]
MTDRTNEELLALALQLSRSDPSCETQERWDAVTALHARPDEAVAKAALGWCESRDMVERTLGADILGQLGYGDAAFPFRAVSLPVLEKLLRDPEAQVAKAALIALHHLGAHESLSKIIALADHESADLRQGVAFALLSQSDPAAVRTLIALSSDSDSQVRDWATFGLGSQIDDDTPEIRDALADRARDPDPATRAEALSGLVKRRDPRALEALGSALRSDFVGTLEVEAARDLGDPALLPDLESLRSWWDVDPRLLEEAIERCRA